MNIIKYPLIEGQYFKQEAKKTQIVIHDTAGADNAKGVIDGWSKDPRKIGTSYVVDRKGQIFEAFDPKYWAAHVGYFITGLGGNDQAYKLLPNTANRETNLAIELRTIGIELTNWEWLKPKPDGKFYTYVNSIVPNDQVVKLDKPFRGFQYYQKYTKEQINSTIELIKVLGAKFNIPLKFSQSFEFDKNAVLGVPGIWQHVNYRFDKVDCSPQPDLINALKQFI